MSAGVTLRPAPGVIEVMIVHRNGKNMRSAPTITTTWRTTTPVIRSGVIREPLSRTAVSAIVAPPLLAADLDDRDSEHDDEEHPGQGARLARPPVPEGEVVDLLDDDLARPGRSAAGHRID